MNSLLEAESKLSYEGKSVQRFRRLTKATINNEQAIGRKFSEKENLSQELSRQEAPIGSRSFSSNIMQRMLAASSASHLASRALILLAVIVLLIAINSECHYMKKRTQYHEQGLHGPKSYKFGYTSGDHKNPQERHEVSDGHGHVKGWYSFVDGAGKHQIVHYEAHPKYGFKIINHKKGYNNGKRHYNS